MEGGRGTERKRERVCVTLDHVRKKQQWNKLWAASFSGVFSLVKETSDVHSRPRSLKEPFLSHFAFCCTFVCLSFGEGLTAHPKSFQPQRSPAHGYVKLDWNTHTLHTHTHLLLLRIPRVHGHEHPRHSCLRGICSRLSAGGLGGCDRGLAASPG